MSRKYLLTYSLAIFSFVGLITFNGCKKWLDVTPKDKVPEEILLSSEQGFIDAINGVYLNMDKSPSTGLTKGLYGNHMTMGLLSVLSYSFDNANASNVGLDGLFFNAAYNFDYNGSLLKPELTNMWRTFYFNIANLNNLLVQIEVKKGLFTEDNYFRIKGEALALRAFLHLDIIRLWGKPPLTAGEEPAVPYVTTYSVVNTPLSSVNGAIDLCIKDLHQARAILANTDTTQVFGASTNMFKAYTQNHCNYWAVKGLLARAFLYKGTRDSANYYANSLIASGKFPLITSNVAAASNTMRDRLFSKELVFSLYSKDLKQRALSMFNSGSTSYPALQLSATGRKRVYETPASESVDWRRTSWFDINLSSVLAPSKFLVDNNLKYELQNIMPLIRISEMYYIATECANAKGNVATGVSYINKVRNARGLVSVNPTITGDSLNSLIRKEYQREFIGEGHTFFYYKRLNLDLKAASGMPIQPPPNAYTFPLPDIEKEYRGN